PAAYAASKSPSLRTTLPGLRAASSSVARYAFESYDTFGPSSHTIFSASRPLIAAHVFLATTATPPSGLKLAGGALGSICTTFTTPGTFIVADASTLTTLPSYTGGRATTAYHTPGRRPAW